MLIVKHALQPPRKENVFSWFWLWMAECIAFDSLSSGGCLQSNVTRMQISNKEQDGRHIHNLCGCHLSFTMCQLFLSTSLGFDRASQRLRHESSCLFVEATLPRLKHANDTRCYFSDPKSNCSTDQIIPCLNALADSTVGVAILTCHGRSELQHELTHVGYTEHKHSNG